MAYASLQIKTPKWTKQKPKKIYSRGNGISKIIYLQGWNIKKSGNFLNTAATIAVSPWLARLWRWIVQDSCQPLLPATPKILHIIVRSSWQIRRYSCPFVPELCLKINHNPLLLCWKLHSTVWKTTPREENKEVSHTFHQIWSWTTPLTIFSLNAIICVNK